MKKGCFLLSLTACLVFGATSVATEITAASDEAYFAVIKCVDHMFYDGGYDVGDEIREAIMNDALALFNQPKYEQSKVDSKNSGALDVDKYISVYSECISGNVSNKLIKIAKSHGMELMFEE
ncbi:MAG: hypothetical protein KKE30_06700 [Gammaproteobacteria bacterium]|nr:hypothetical protein [Gammaproteobacteria bacterium]MBU1554938.1 hypothetical protein [Gammaproteobacteria bacterium]MBU2070945.1 hypothetical protein [Gammaproteobacteria bacterium]MBU2181547.1 hypothetical protein [Gammaproteobacteria bacterium]MBU2204875.1 hypothetical protein [Gammaproteobacteria bacterium]